MNVNQKITFYTEIACCILFAVFCINCFMKFITKRKDEKKLGNEKIEKYENVYQPRRKFASSKKKIALQIGIILLYFLVIGYCGRQNESVSDWLFAFLLVSLLAGFLLWRQRPVWVELYEDKMCYRSFLGKQQEFFYTQMQSIDFVKKMYTVGMIVPIYGYTKYSIYLEENGKKKKLNMNSLSCDDFVMIWRTFLEYGETREDKELCENMKTPYFYKSFSVPTKKLKDTYYYNYCCIFCVSGLGNTS